ncbi:hypothetical protein [Halomarina rubra]|uniref:Uncharacterized protein n=1 Tax=Halomarina rubra TaxID=2071873 RepID=A0ABD6B1M2_9EURY|nr:hypothetical protein [Halomarina rubra]
MADTVRLRNEYGTRLTGGPADIRAEAGEEVDVPAADAAYYVDNYDFVRVGESSDDTPPSEDLTVAIDGEEHAFADLSYRQLQALAGEYDDVAGNGSAEELRTALREKVA